MQIGSVENAVEIEEIVLLGQSGDVEFRLANLLLENTDAVDTAVSRRARGNADQFGHRLRSDAEMAISIQALWRTQVDNVAGVSETVAVRAAL